MSDLILEHVTMAYETKQEQTEILHDINMTIKEGESVALVGESGCGKSQLMRTLLHLNRTNRVLHGAMLWNGCDILHWNEKQMKEIRHHQIAMIFQDPKMALDPIFSIGTQMMECCPASCNKREKRLRCIEALHQVHIQDAKRMLHRYPHELSIGMCQRIMIAMVLLSDAALWICDEATSSLDVSVQADLLQLIRSLQLQRHISMIFITHDLRLIPMMCERVYIMKHGRIIESCPAATLFHEEHQLETMELIHAVSWNMSKSNT